MSALSVLKESDKITKETASEAEEMVSERRDTLRQYNDQLREEYGQTLENERDKALDTLDKIKQQKLDELSNG